MKSDVPGTSLAPHLVAPYIPKQGNFLDPHIKFLAYIGASSLVVGKQQADPTKGKQANKENTAKTYLLPADPKHHCS